ncbi:Dipeptidyl aminopeptidase/acylaminoacyl peptidase [Flavobacterium segetis]|uniref:Dipeptidyl aminopeptidase/acylaminoacyl peptidase n=1 Tax=Flavobacterium segetis TaxID=271157 RepID=A0A1M5IER9_9FLAO|nr:prolyl oligopeptidase family serine peptidase [Flavobacterium segetis]SHG26848.1 Dipeptidyl aminopeptidase/acylaminoacyl peptidase [Flavobacterium segetis]
MKSKTKIAPILLILIMSLGMMMKTAAQVKRKLQPADYNLWSTIYPGTVSHDGKWVSYTLNYGDKKDTLFLKNAITNYTYLFSAGANGTISKDGKWFGCNVADTLKILNLETGKQQSFPKISKYLFAAHGRYVIGVQNTDEKQLLWIKDLKSDQSYTVQNVNEFKLSPDSGLLAVVSEINNSTAVKIYSLQNSLQEQKIIASSENTYMGIAWDETGKGFAFFEEISNNENSLKEHKIYYCTGFGKKIILKTPPPQYLDSLTQRSYIPLSRLFISSANEKVFFDIKNREQYNEHLAGESDVQIWNTDDAKVPPSRQPSSEEVSCSVWHINSGEIKKVEDAHFTNAVPTGYQNNALVFRMDEYLPRHKYGGEYIDVYIKNLLTGKVELVVKKQLLDMAVTTVSPTGKFVCYFKNNNWWTYNIASKRHTCLTESLNIPFYDTEYDESGIPPAYGNPGWSKSDEYLIIYDKFDIWLLSPDGITTKKITEGRKQNVTYRIAEEGSLYNYQADTFFFLTKSFNLDDGLLLHSVNNESLDEGLSLWTNRNLRSLVEKNKKIIFIEKSKDNKNYLFREESFDTPPALVLINRSGQEKVIIETNDQQKNFYWGKSELIRYSTPEGKELKGALFYPANYQSGLKYPMIVHIYSRRAQELHEYVEPSFQSGNGLNIANFTAEGYFVLLPDIAYTVNDPGDSALKCVKAAVEKVIESGTVDREKIGLMGHSFGGYETAYIITQTDMFKAAVAGAPVTDIVSAYLMLDGNGQSNIWRYEDQQFRIKSPFYTREFLKNSPILQVEKISTPVLLWTGEEDHMVNPTNSTKLQIALWRLGKKSRLLVYPNEDHVLTNPENKKNLYFEIKRWFDLHLKNL